MAFANLHSHTHYCDGTDAPETYLQAALEAGLVGYGFSGHAPLPFPTPWAMKAEAYAAYRSEIHALKECWANRIEVHCGLEVDFIPQLIGASHFAAELDYTIGSVHFVDTWPDGTPFEADGPTVNFDKGLQAIFAGDIRTCMERYFSLVREMVLTDPPDIVGHLDKLKIHNRENRLWSESATWYRDAMMHTLEVISKGNVLVEVNTRGHYLGKTADLYPSKWVLREMRSLGIRPVISSDAHHPRQVAGSFDLAAQMLRDADHGGHWLLRQGEWQEARFA
jgi:histidinol-phosphatase (PHP family)